MQHDPILKKVNFILGWGGGHFWLQGHNLNKLGRGHVVSDKKIFHDFLFSLCKPCEPWGRAIFGPKGII